MAFTDSRGLGGGVLRRGGSCLASTIGQGATCRPLPQRLQLAAIGCPHWHAQSAGGPHGGIVSRLQHYPRAVVWCQAGVNDYACGTYTPSQLTSFLRAWLTGLRQALPAARVYLETDGPKADESPNKLGFTLQQYRDAEAAGAQGLATVVPGSAMWTLADLQDGTHLSMAGDDHLLPKLQAILGR